MPLSLKTHLVPARTIGCALVSCLAMALGAHAAEEHGDGHETPKASSSVAKQLPRGASVEAKAPLGQISYEGRNKFKGREKDMAPEPKGAALAETGSSSVSMSELRDLIDQKIAEVRTKRETPPVVRLRPKAAKHATPKKPASEIAAPATPAEASLHASLGPAATKHAPNGALLPVSVEHVEHVGHDHGAVGGRALNPMGRDVHWAYSGDTGPDHWGRLKPEFQQCMLGKRQSPIDIREGIPVQLDPIQFDYRPSTFRVIDNGHTVQVNVDMGNGITVQGRRYELVQFHFHRPSEERINGRQFEMSAHLVHKDAEGRLAVVAVLMEAGKGHPLVQQVWNNLPLEKHMEQAGLTTMDLRQLLPERQQYYTYMGSLTTPPCSEGVLWMVMKNPSTVSREQIGVFGKLYQMNARPIQSAAGRLIKEGQ